MMTLRAPFRLLCAAAFLVCAGRPPAHAQVEAAGEVRVRLVQEFAPRSSGETHASPAVVWLKPTGDRSLPNPARGRYTLLQKNRMFTPHLLVVPVGSVVVFPNADPFFHNVFSLFDGKRFDLGLYEAGSSKEVNFSREGLSYIFCNIHPEMSAIVIALSTPIFAVADAKSTFQMHDVPPGDYELHLWVEGEMQPALEKLTRRVHIGPGRNDLGALTLSAPPQPAGQHENKFGQPYGPDPHPEY